MAQPKEGDVCSVWLPEHTWKTPRIRESPASAPEHLAPVEVRLGLCVESQHRAVGCVMLLRPLNSDHMCDATNTCTPSWGTAPWSLFLILYLRN